MAWTPASFKARWTEFNQTDDTLVQSALGEAASRCDARVFGPDYDAAVALMAAHLLSISPQGQQARLDSDKAETTYGAEWKRLARQRAGGAWAIGQRP